MTRYLSILFFVALLAPQPAYSGWIGYIKDACFGIRTGVRGKVNRKLRNAVQTINDGMMDGAKVRLLFYEILSQGGFPESILKKWPPLQQYKHLNIEIEFAKDSYGGSTNGSGTIKVRVGSSKDIIDVLLHEYTHTGQDIFVRSFNKHKMSKQEWVGEGIKFEIEAFSTQIEAVLHLREAGLEINSSLADMWASQKRYIYPKKKDSMGDKDTPGFKKSDLVDVSDVPLETFIKDYLLAGYSIFSNNAGIEAPLTINRAIDYYQVYGAQYGR